jgi:peptide/nickel transport system ATP-binding protein
MLSERPFILEVTGLTLTFSREAATPNLLDGVSFSVREGETLCIVGESGSGKSVTSLALMGLLPSPPARIVAGTAMFEGQDLLKLPERALADIRGNRMSMIFQEPMTSLNPVYTVGQQIAEGIERHRGARKDEARAEALELLRQVGIPAAESRLDAYPHELSGGMRQRVMIAMALANRPKLLIADEPTTALDVTIQAQVLSLVRSLQQATGTAMVLITHDLGVVAEMADEVAVMYAGTIVECGSVAEIFDDPQHPYTIGLMGAVPTTGKRRGPLATIRGAVPPPEQMPRGCRFSPRCPFAEPRCHETAPATRMIGGTHRVACHLAPLEALATDMPRSRETA